VPSLFHTLEAFVFGDKQTPDHLVIHLSSAILRCAYSGNLILSMELAAASYVVMEITDFSIIITSIE